jgi:hypothetical protein
MHKALAAQIFISVGHNIIVRSIAHKVNHFMSILDKSCLRKPAISISSFSVKGADLYGVTVNKIECVVL